MLFLFFLCSCCLKGRSAGMVEWQTEVRMEPQSPVPDCVCPSRHKQFKWKRNAWFLEFQEHQNPLMGGRDSSVALAPVGQDPEFHLRYSKQNKTEQILLVRLRLELPRENCSYLIFKRRTVILRKTLGVMLIISQNVQVGHFAKKETCLISKVGGRLLWSRGCQRPVSSAASAAVGQLDCRALCRAQSQPSQSSLVFLLLNPVQHRGQTAVTGFLSALGLFQGLKGPLTFKLLITGCNPLLASSPNIWALPYLPLLYFSDCSRLLDQLLSLPGEGRGPILACI